MANESSSPTKKRTWEEPCIEKVPLEASQQHVMIYCKIGNVSGPSVTHNCNPGVACVFQSPKS